MNIVKLVIASILAGVFVAGPARSANTHIVSPSILYLEALPIVPASPVKKKPAPQQAQDKPEQKQKPVPVKKAPPAKTTPAKTKPSAENKANKQDAKAKSAPKMPWLKGDFVYWFSDVSALKMPKGMTLEFTASKALGIPVTVMSGNIAKKPSSGGQTQGIGFQLSEQAEAAFSGKKIRIELIARAAKGKQAAFEVAYSTNEVGNSGWKTLKIGEAFAPVTFSYKVQPLKAGKGDFLGILPDPKGIGQRIEVLGFSVSIEK